MSARREGGGFAASDGLKGQNGPLVVGHLQDHRREVNMNESQRGMKARLPETVKKPACYYKYKTGNRRP